MPHRVAELQKISAELMLLAQRATDIGDMQLAKMIVDAVTLANADRAKISQEIRHRVGESSLLLPI